MCRDKNNVLTAEKLLRLRLRIFSSLRLFLLAFCEKVSVSEYIIFYCKFVGGG